jgi:acetyltransferase-like isoleucine patch superfamily enzyme
MVGLWDTGQPLPPGVAGLPSLPIPPDQFPPEGGSPLRQQAQLAGWWAGYGARQARGRWKLRGFQKLGGYVTVGGNPHINTDDCEVGERFRIWSSYRQTLIAGWGRIRIGDDVFINSGSVVFSVLEVVIEDDVALANEVYVCDSHSHGIAGADPIDAPVRIGRGSWIGARSIILPGVDIGSRVMVAAGSVVTRDVPDDSLVAGNPARVLRTLDYPVGCLRAWHDIWCRCPLKDQVAAAKAAAADAAADAPNPDPRGLPSL